MSEIFPTGAQTCLRPVLGEFCSIDLLDGASRPDLKLWARSPFYFIKAIALCVQQIG